jgi:hypothetical protein
MREKKIIKKIIINFYTHTHTYIQLKYVILYLLK